MIVKRPKLIEAILGQIGSSRRINEKSPYLSKQELMQIKGWIDTAKSFLDAREKNNESGKRTS